MLVAGASTSTPQEWLSAGIGSPDDLFTLIPPTTLVLGSVHSAGACDVIYHVLFVIVLDLEKFLLF